MSTLKKAKLPKPTPFSIWQSGSIVGWFGSFPAREAGGARFPQLLMSTAFQDDKPFQISSTHFMLRSYDTSIANASGHPADKIYLNALCDVLVLEKDTPALLDSPSSPGTPDS